MHVRPIDTKCYDVRNLACERILYIFTVLPPPPTCARTEFTCNDGTCIPAEYECDDQVDCSDNSDEANCGMWNINVVLLVLELNIHLWEVLLKYSFLQLELNIHL